jgi:NAD+ synthase (glutamine-hydrolysing)
VPTLRLALAQMNATVGDLEGNAATIARLRTQAASLGADLVATPELSLLGYPPEDLLLKEGFIAATQRSVDGLERSSALPPVLVGTVAEGLDLAPSGDSRDGVDPFDRRQDRPRIANAVVALDASGVVATATKRLLPNYDVFDERRYFMPGVGPHTIVNLQGIAVGILICEDVWLSNGPAAALVAEGATLLVVTNASPFARGRRAEREGMLAERARELNVPIAYVNMVGGQDELVFDGQSFVVSASGEIIARAGAFREELLVVDVEAQAGSAGVALQGAKLANRDELLVPRLADPPSEVAEVYDALVTGTRDYLRKNGFRSAVIALSGGIDSSLVAAIAVDAVGSTAVKGYALPSRYSSDHSLSDAEDLAERLDIEIRTIPIDPAHVALEGMLGGALDHEVRGLTEENLQSRIRGVLMMGISNDSGAIVLTTGNKSEMAVGYTTLYGDSAGGFAVIKDVPKTLVYQLCHYRNDLALELGDQAPIPNTVLTKAPSAELRPGQRDDQSLPPYEELDPLLELYVEQDVTADQLIERGYDRALVERITRLVDFAEYKRRQMPPGVRITAKAFGRDRRMPITNAFRTGAK